MKKYTLSVIMPALNEEKNIEKAVETTLAALKDNEINGEIIIINDGSTDNTAEIIQVLIQKYDNIKTIMHEKPQGIGRSVWDGFKASKRDIVVYFPADNENNPNETFLFFDLMEKVDIIAPFVHNIEVRDKKRRLVSSLYNFIINMSFGIKLNYHNGTTLFRRVILEDIELSSYGFFYQAELLIKLIRKGYLFVEVPNYLDHRTSGQSKALNWKSFKDVAKGYLNLAYNIHIKAIEGHHKYKKLHTESITYIRNQEHENKIKADKEEYANV
jgi:glycosyltransferase involved in cell wall biosynthesis